MHDALVYISKPTFPAAHAGRVVSSIVGPAETRNAALGITGALIATEHHFAQVIEGRAEAIDTLLESIRRDPRHRAMTIVRRENGVARRFGAWSLAYQGRSAYFDGFISALVSERDRRRADVDRLVDLLSRLAAPHRCHPLQDLAAS